MAASSTATINLQVVMGGNGTSGLNALGAGFGGAANSALGLWQMLEIGRMAMDELQTSTDIAQQTFELFSQALDDVITAAGNMEFSMTQADIAIKGGTQDAAQLQDSIISLADSGLYSTQQVADGFVQLGKKGQDVNEIVNQTGAAMVYLAESIGSDTVPAATLLSTSMETFNLKGADAMDTANLLTGAFYMSGDSVSQLQEALNMAGAEAHLMNIPFSDFVETIVLLSQAGLRGSQAGSSLRYMLSSLADPTSKAQTELAALGLLVINSDTPAFRNFEGALSSAGKAGATAVNNFDGTLASLNSLYTAAKSLGVLKTNETFFQWATQAGFLSDKMFNADGSFVGMQKALDNIKGALDKMPASDVRDRANALGQLFNVRSGQGAQLLTGIQDLDTKWNTLNTDLKNSSAVKDAQKLTDTWNGSMQRLGTTFNSTMAFIGQNVTPVLKPFIDQLNSILSDVMKNHPEWLKWAAIILVVGTAVSGVALVIGTLIAGFVTVVVFIVPIIGLFATAAGVVMGLWMAIQHGMQFVHGIGSMFQSAGTDLHNFVGRLGDLKDQVGKVLGFIGQFFQTTGNNIGHAFQQGFNIAKTFVTTTLNNIRQSVQTAMTFVGNIFQTVVHAIGGVFNWLYDHWYPWQHMVDGIKMIVTDLMKLLQSDFNYLKVFIPATFNEIKTNAQNAWNAITGTIGNAVGNAWTLVQANFNKVKGFLGGIWTWLENSVKTAWNLVVTNVSNALGKVWSVISGAAGHAAGAVKTGVVDPITNAINGILKQVGQWGHNIVQFLANGIKNAAGLVVQSAKDVIGGIAKVMQFHSPTEEGPGSTADTWAPNLMKMYAGGILAGIPGVTSAASAVTGSLANQFTGVHATTSLANGTRGIGAVGAGGVNIPIYLDSNLIAQAFFNMTTGQLQTQGAARIFR